MKDLKIYSLIKVHNEMTEDNFLFLYNHYSDMYNDYGEFLRAQRAGDLGEHLTKELDNKNHLFDVYISDSVAPYENAPINKDIDVIIDGDTGLAYLYNSRELKILSCRF